MGRLARAQLGNRSAVGSSAQGNRAKSCRPFTCDGAKGYPNLKLNKVTVTSRKTKRLQDLSATKTMDKSIP